jgi:hypothetical protein
VRLFWGHPTTRQLFTIVQGNSRTILAVDYKDEYTPISYLRASREELVNTLFSVKSGSWKYESEWRVVESKRTGVQIFPKGMLAEITLGCQASSEFESTVIEAIHEITPKPKLFRAKKVWGKFTLEREEILVKS